jgi:hypothetical protein
MAGKRFGVVMAARVPGSYFALPEQEREVPGIIFEQLMMKYADKVDLVRRYWTSGFSADVSDFFVMECDDLRDAHNFNQEMTTMMAEGGEPERFGVTVTIWAGVNPDAT